MRMEKQIGQFLKTTLSLSIAASLVLTAVGCAEAEASSIAPLSASQSVQSTQNDAIQGLRVIEMYSKVQIETDTILTDYIASPRELDDYHELGLYDNAGVPYEVTELRLDDSTALDEFPDASTKYEALSLAISNQVYDGLMKNQAVFFTGADCNTAVGVAGGVRRAYPDARIGLIYLDAHGDIHMAASAQKSGVAAILGIDEAQADLWNLVSGDGAVFNGLLLSDGRAMDAEETKNLEQAASSGDYYYCTQLDTEAFNDSKQWTANVRDLADAMDVIYLHIDADVLHQAYITHMDAGEGEGPIVWTMMENLETVMETGKVVAVNLSSMYSEDTDTALSAHEFTVPEFPVETATERVNRFAMPSIVTAIRMICTMFENWTEMPPAPDSTSEVPEIEAVDTSLNGMKVVEIRTRNQTGGVLVGRRAAAPMATDGLYTYEQRGEVIEEQDLLFLNRVGYPRELDDWTLSGVYDQIGVPWEMAQVYLTDKDADKKYPELTRYEALSKEVSDEVYEGLVNNQVVTVVGSGCMPVTAVSGGFRRAYGDDATLGVVYIDAHGDINTADSTFSGGIGGMDLAPVMGIDPHPTIQHWWSVCSDDGEPINELFHACARDLDSGVDTYNPNNTYEFGEMLNLESAVSDEKFILSVDEFNDSETFEDLLTDFAERVDAIYLHIDMDALDGAFMPNAGSPVGYHTSPEKIGPSVWTVVERIESVMKTGKVAVVNLASTYGDPEYDPERLLRQGFVYPTIEGEDLTSEYAKNRANTTAILSGMRVLNSMISNWKDSPEISGS